MKEKDTRKKLEELKDRAIDEETLKDVSGGFEIPGSTGSMIDTELPNAKTDKSKAGLHIKIR